MPAEKQLPFTRYIWCDSCGHFEAFTLSTQHEAALGSKCPSCGSHDIASLPPAHHTKRLARNEARA